MNRKKMKINNSILNYSYNLVVYKCDSSENIKDVHLKKNYNEKLFTTVNNPSRCSFFLL